MPLVRYAGYDREQPEPEPIPAPPRQTNEHSELRDCRVVIAALNDRVKSLERALQAAHRVIAPYAHANDRKK